ncbi:YdcF family protein [Microbacteriaceae bacterium 4G12]
MKKRFLLSIIAVIALYVALASYLMISTAKKQPKTGADYLLILGAKINGETVSLSLRERLDTALQYLKENPNTIAIVSGGQGSDEAIPEAHAMQRYLLERGIQQERILIEDKSTNTYENLKFSKQLYHFQRVVIVSNDFHLYRVKLIASRLGIEAETLAAPTPWKAKAKSYSREYFAILKTWIWDR